MVTLIIGGARSGKSRYAERCAVASQREVVYIATAVAGDDEMARRIEHHRRHRPGSWRTVEEPVALARALQQQAAPARCLVVDCLTLWLSNLLFEQCGSVQETLFGEQRSALLAALPRLAGDILLVSNEVGLGIVPDNPVARRFIDEAGLLHQELAERCARVVWMIAGLPHIVKDAEPA
jgi:adenosylcobinamide kinase/adenosylcobinamide-phosphate guanylyltransferase